MPCPDMSLLSPFPIMSLSLLSFFDFFSFLGRSSSPPTLSPHPSGTGEEELVGRGSLGRGGARMEVLSLPMLLLLMVPLARMQVLQLAALGDAGLWLSLACLARSIYPRTSPQILTPPSRDYNDAARDYAPISPEGECRREGGSNTGGPFPRRRGSVAGAC